MQPDEVVAGKRRFYACMGPVIVTAQAADPDYDYRAKVVELDSIVFDMYQLTIDERQEILDWYRRHYPKLFQPDAAEA